MAQKFSEFDPFKRLRRQLEVTAGLLTHRPRRMVQALTVIPSCQGLYMKGKDVTPLASMLKLKAGRISREVTDSCLQYWGGMGFAMDSIITRFYRSVGCYD